MLAVLAGSASALAASAPDPTMTPGATDPRVTQDTITTTICTRGYTTTVRNVSTQTKHAVYVAYGISTADQHGYVIDHLIPLEVGGANDAKNLWPETELEATTKDGLENAMHAAVCAGRISLATRNPRFEGNDGAASTPPAARSARRRHTGTVGAGRAPRHVLRPGRRDG